MHATRKPRRYSTRAAIAVLTMSLVTLGLAAPAGAQEGRDPATAWEGVVEGILQEAEQKRGEAEAWIEAIVPEGEARLAEIGASAQAGDWDGVKAQADALKADAECAVFEFDFKFSQTDAIRHDFANGVSNATLEIPCRLREPVPVTLVSWNLQFGAPWGLSPQGQTDKTDTVWVQDPGTYTFQVDLPRPTADPEHMKAALRQAGLGVLADGNVGNPGDLLPDTDEDGEGEEGGSLLDALDLDAILAALTPEQISGLLDFICPFQVDLVATESSNVPESLVGQGSANAGAPGIVSLSTIIDGTVGHFPVKNGNITNLAAQAPPAVQGAATSAADRALNDLPPAPPLSALADAADNGDAGDPGDLVGGGGDGSDDGGGLLGGLDFSVLCVDATPAVEAAQATPDSSVSVLSTGGTLPRTGAETPGIAATGIALILAGWLVLAANAFLRVRERTLHSR